MTERERPRPGGAVSAGAVVASLLAAGSLRPLLQGDSWWWEAAVFATLAVGTAALIRRVGRLRHAAPFAGLLVLALLTSWIWAPGATLWGLPTPGTLVALAGRVGTAVEQIRLASPPAEVTGELQLLVVLCIAALALLVDALAVGARLPWLAGIPLLLVTIVPGRAIRTGENLVAVAVSVLALLLLVWLDRRRDRARPATAPAIAISAGAVVGALLIQSFVPALGGVDTATATPLRPVFAPGVDPLLRLGEHLRRGADVPVLTYRTTATEPLYLRVVTIDDLEGEVWEPMPPEYRDPDSAPIDALPAPPGLEDEVDRAEVVTEVTAAYDQRTWLPVPYPAVSVEGVDDRWAGSPDDLSIAARRGATAASSYTVTSLQLDPTQEQLRAADPNVGEDLLRYLDLPDDRPSSIGSLAGELAAGEPTAYDQAVAIQSYLRSSEFHYDEQAPERSEGDDGMALVETFLASKRGYCIHFAAAMTVMSRELGIPARIAVGYQPGERSVRDRDVYEVSSHDLHAWPELYFEGVGWTRFEPTPGRGDVPSPRADEEAPAAVPQPVPTSTPSTPAGQRPDQEEANGPSGSTASGPALTGLAWIAGVLVLFAAPALVRLSRRGRRVPRRGECAATGAWDELEDTIADLGLGAGRDSPREIADLIARHAALTSEDAARLARLRDAVERARFGPPSQVAVPADAAFVRGLLRGLGESSNWPVRIRAALLPTSLALRLAESIRDAARGALERLRRA